MVATRLPTGRNGRSNIHCCTLDSMMAGRPHCSDECQLEAVASCNRSPSRPPDTLQISREFPSMPDIGLDAETRTWGNVARFQIAPVLVGRCANPIAGADHQTARQCKFQFSISVRCDQPTRYARPRIVPSPALCAHSPATYLSQFQPDLTPSRNRAVANENIVGVAWIPTWLPW